MPPIKCGTQASEAPPPLVRAGHHSSIPTAILQPKLIHRIRAMLLLQAGTVALRKLDSTVCAGYPAIAELVSHDSCLLVTSVEVTEGRTLVLADAGFFAHVPRPPPSSNYNLPTFPSAFGCDPNPLLVLSLKPPSSDCCM